MAGRARSHEGYRRGEGGAVARTGDGVIVLLARQAQRHVPQDMCPHERGCARTRNGENLSEVTPHTLRRTFGSDLLNRGLRLEVVSKLLGHASTVVTERAYAELLDDTMRRELLRVLERAA